MAQSDLTGFLKRDEKTHLQTLYEDWINQLNPDSFIPKLFSTNLVSVYDQQNIDAEKVKIKKSSIIFHDVLMRSTYEDLSRMRQLLVETGDNSHIYLAKKLPNRGEPINYDPPPPKYPKNEKYSQQCTDPNTKAFNDDTFVVGIDQGHGQPTGLLEEAMEVDLAYSSGKPLRNIFKSKKGDKNQPVEKITSYYTCKGSAPTATGRGLCMVIRNFSDDLKGYQHDAALIRNFFENALDYTVLEGRSETFNLVDLCWDEFETALNYAVSLLKPDDSPYDRFFLFVLSHGDDKGIKMNLQGSKTEEEPEKRYKVDDIIGKFTHDKIFQMKDYPKCFFIQACRGELVAQAAADTVKSSEDQKAVKYFRNPLPLAVGRDILICYPTAPGHYSWVPGSGSWFIREAISALWKYYRSEHLLDIMVEVANHVSGITKPGLIPSAEGGSLQESVYQMPNNVCNLTRKFYLYYPPEK